MAAVFLVARTGRQLAPAQLILCGVVLSALLESVNSFLSFRGNPQATQSILFWLLGSFGNASWTQLPIPALSLIVAMGYLPAPARSLNTLAMGSEPAASLRVDVTRPRRNLLIVTSLMVGVAVAVSGVIGFVGLVVPHIVRLLVGSEHRRVLPVGVLFGARSWSSATCWRGPSRRRRRCPSGSSPPSSALPRPSEPGDVMSSGQP
jgi:iron complex transport system permease protein